MLLESLLKEFDEAVNKPKFTGYWKAQDKAPPGKKMVGEEEKTTEASTLDTDIEYEPSVDQEFDKKELAALLTQKLTGLAPKEERAIRLKIFYDYTYDQIGEKFGVSGDRARDIFMKGIRKLRHPSRAREIRPFLEDENPTDKITMDIPLFLRMMEYAKEDAKTDMDLHQVTARAIELMQQHDYLCMDNYDTIINNSEPIDEGWLDKVYSAGRNFADTATLGGYKYARAGADYAAKNIGNKLGFDVKPTTYQKELDQEVEKLNKDWEKEPGASLAGMGGAMALPLAGQYGAAVKGAQGLGGQALDAYGKFVKTYPLAKKALGLENKDEDIDEEKKGLYYYVNKRKKAGTSRPASHPKAPSEQDWKNAAKTAKKESVGEAGQFSYGAKTPRKGTVAYNAAQKRKEDEKRQKPIEPKDQMVGVAKVTKEGKEKGADGKACWPGYRYAGTENGKDKCVKVKK